MNPHTSKKLVLFDIDETLIRYSGKRGRFSDRIRYAAKKVFGITMDAIDTSGYHGFVERQSTWDALSRYGITRKEFRERFTEFGAAMHEFFLLEAQKGQLFYPIPEAKRVTRMLKKKTSHELGLISGNIERIGRWKLAHAGVDDIFSFGVFGDDVEDRSALAHSIFPKARLHYRRTILPHDIMIIGDTVHDVLCARAIGASVILVTTGTHTSYEVLALHNPDLLVDSLMDRRVLSLLG